VPIISKTEYVKQETPGRMKSAFVEKISCPEKIKYSANNWQFFTLKRLWYVR